MKLYCLVTPMSFVAVFNTSLFVGAPNTDGSLTVLKIGSFLLLLALAVVTVVLIYFVKKKVHNVSHISTQTHASS